MLTGALNKVYIASGMLSTMVDHPSLNDEQVKDELLNDLWFRRARAFGKEDNVDMQIERAVTNLKAICRPIFETNFA